MAQSLDTLWTKCIGGSAQEVTGTVQLNNVGMDMVSTCLGVDSNYYVASYSQSSNGYVSSNAGDIDGFLVKISPSGDTVWTKVLGGSGFDKIFKVKPSANGGCYVIGQTQSNDGFFTGNHGMGDGFIAKFDNSGNLIFKKCYGGSSADILYDLEENPAGNVVACGESISSDGDLAGTGAGYCWMLFANGNNGTVSNSQVYTGPNGSNPDALENYSVIKRLSDGTGYIVAGFTGPDFSNFNLDDIHVAKINFAGTKLWSTAVGSATGRDGSSAIIEGSNGGFYVTGWLGGSGGDAAQYLGGSADAWLTYFNASGNLVWEKNFGGTNFEFFTDGKMDAAGNLFLSGFTRSVDNLLANTTSSGLWDFWTVKTDSAGNFLNQFRLGGASNDVCLGMSALNNNNEFLMVGFTDSNEGFVHGNNGGRDIWVTKMAEPISTGLQNEKNKQLISFYPNPNNGSFTVVFDSQNTASVLEFKIYNLSSALVYHETLSGNNLYHQINCNLESGIYFAKVYSNHQIIGVQKLMVTH